MHEIGLLWCQIIIIIFHSARIFSLAVQWSALVYATQSLATRYWNYYYCYCCYYDQDRIILFYFSIYILNFILFNIFQVKWNNVVLRAERWSDVEGKCICCHCSMQVQRWQWSERCCWTQQSVDSWWVTLCTAMNWIFIYYLYISVCRF